MLRHNDFRKPQFLALFQMEPTRNVADFSAKDRAMVEAFYREETYEKYCKSASDSPYQSVFFRAKEAQNQRLAGKLRSLCPPTFRKIALASQDWFEGHYMSTHYNNIRDEDLEGHMAVANEKMRRGERELEIARKNHSEANITTTYKELCDLQTECKLRIAFLDKLDSLVKQPLPLSEQIRAAEEMFVTEELPGVDRAQEKEWLGILTRHVTLKELSLLHILPLSERTSAAERLFATVDSSGAPSIDDAERKEWLIKLTHMP